MTYRKRMQVARKEKPMDEMVNLILNSSVTIVIIAYFIYRDNKFMGQLQQTLTTLVDTVDTLKDMIVNAKKILEKEE